MPKPNQENRAQRWMGCDHSFVLPEIKPGQAESEGHRKAHVTQVQRGRMESHAGVAQQRVEAQAVGRYRRKGGKGILHQESDTGEESGQQAQDGGCDVNRSGVLFTVGVDGQQAEERLHEAPE